MACMCFLLFSLKRQTICLHGTIGHLLHSVRHTKSIYFYILLNRIPNVRDSIQLSAKDKYNLELDTCSKSFRNILLKK